MPLETGPLVHGLLHERGCEAAPRVLPFRKSLEKQLQVVIDVEDVILRRCLDSQIV